MFGRIQCLRAGLALGLGTACTAYNQEGLFPFLDAKTPGRSRTKGFVYRSWRTYEVEEVKSISKDTKQVRFLFEDEDIEAGYRTISAILGRAKDPKTGEYVKAGYYPITRNADKGYFDVVIKKQEGDIVGEAMQTLKPGDKFEFKGALPTFPWRSSAYSNLGIIAGGAGILPIYQLLQEVLGNVEDRCRVSLVYACKSKEDILFKKQLDKLAQKHPERFRVQYVVESPPMFWGGHKGLITNDIVKTNLPPPGRGTLIMVSGPDGMLDAVCGPMGKDKEGWPVQGPVKGILMDCGYRKTHIHKL